MTDEIRWYLLFLCRNEKRVTETVKKLRVLGIEPILIKGLAAGRYYPMGYPRYFSDIDLAVPCGDFDKAEASADLFGIDLHRELRHLDTLPWEDLFSRSEVFEIDGTAVRVLCPEDHLRVLCVHWLTDGGENKERLWDIYYLIESTRGTFDWEKCLEPVSPTRRKWVTAVVGLANRYLDLDISGLPIENEAKDLPDWLVRSVERSWASGVRLQPLHTCLGDFRALTKQVRKRIPPNPVQATIDCEGVFDARSRLPYQLRDAFLRLAPSLRRIVPAIIGRFRQDSDASNTSN